MKSHLSVILTCVFVVFSACSNDETYELFPEFATSQALMSDVSISLMEQTQTADTLQAEEPGLYLYIETTELYPYCNYGILRSTFQADDTLIVRLEDLIKPSVTLIPAGRASTSAKIPENTKHIVLLRGDESNSFKLTIEKESLLLEPVNASFTNSTHLLYSRDIEPAP